jgi:hypothetical protein
MAWRRLSVKVNECLLTRVTEATDISLPRMSRAPKMPPTSMQWMRFVHAMRLSMVGSSFPVFVTDLKTQSCSAPHNFQSLSCACSSSSCEWPAGLHCWRLLWSIHCCYYICVWTVLNVTDSL